MFALHRTRMLCLWSKYVQDFPASWMKLWTGIYQLFWVCSSDLRVTTFLSLLNFGSQLVLRSPGAGDRGSARKNASCSLRAQLPVSVSGDSQHLYLRLQGIGCPLLGCVGTQTCAQIYT